ncbi:MAG: trypsin-like peptidase domain-containing protein [Candidatus Bathyarchaeia archaeon]
MSALDERIMRAVEKVSPAVVNISTVRLVQDYLFHVHPVQGMGSGFIVDARGYIASNNHVIAGSEEVSVTSVDGRKLAGRVIGADPTSDVALLKVDGSGLPTAELGDSDRLRVGQVVVAIGNPFGFALGGGPTVTMGLVSALKRNIQAQDRVFEGLIQTDAAINPGNSGGPLVDLDGRVIGVNTAMIPFAQGIGFAIPINEVKTRLEDLAKYGRVIRPWIGIVGLDLTREMAAYYGLPVSKGVVVARVLHYSPAFEAGLREGDILLRLNETELNTVGDLQGALKTKKPGDTVKLIVLRDGRRGTASVKLGETPQT